MGQSVRDHYLHRLQPDLLSAIRSRLHGDAAPLLGLLAHAGVARSERALDSRLQHSRGRISAADGVLLVVFALRKNCRRQSMDGHWPGVANALSATHLQL